MQSEIDGNTNFVTSFVNGIRNDIDAVKNAIELTYNNGLAEGSVNKIKVIKRIMHGRNSFSLLKGKVLRLESKKKTN
ncbi:MAG: transposase [Eubacteriales bacterium]